MKFVGHTKGILSVHFSPIPGYVVTGSWDGTARLWEIESGKIIRTFANHKDVVLATAVSPDGNYVLTGSYDKTARLWAANPDHDARTIHAVTGRINLVNFLPDGKSILSSSADNSVRLWNAKTLAPDGVLSTALLDPKAVVSAQGNWIAASSGVYQGSEFKLVFWKRTQSGYLPVDLAVDSVFSYDRIATLSFSPQTNGQESEYLLLGLEHGNLVLLHNRNDVWEVAKQYYGPSFPHHVAFTPNLSYLASTSTKSEMAYAQVPIYRLDDESTPVADCVSALSSGSGFGSSAIAFSRDQNPYLVAGMGNDVLLLNWKPDASMDTGQGCSVVKRLSGHESPVTNLMFSPDGRYLLSGSLDGTAILWDANSWEIRRILAGHDGEVTTVDFSQDGKHIVTGGYDNTIRIWDTNYVDTIHEACSLLKQFNRDFTAEERQKYQITDELPTCK
jgi:WD40 repeat protein